jgi:hypothetical protein
VKTGRYCNFNSNSKHRSKRIRTSKARSNAAKSRAQLKKWKVEFFKEFVLNAAISNLIRRLATQEQIEKNRKAISEAEEARVAKEIAEQRLSNLLQRLKGGN